MGRRKNQPVTPSTDLGFDHGSALSAEAREREIIAAAYNLAEKQIREGTASAQVITHFLKLGSTREHLEREIMEAQANLAKAKAESIESNKDKDLKYQEAIDAMRSYQPTRTEEDDENLQ